MVSTATETQGAYPLTTNSLQTLVAYTERPTGVALVSKVSLPAGSLFTPITTATSVSSPIWSTVQTGRDSHIELNSALLYMNHSCAPSLEVDTQKMEVRVARDRELKEGDDLTVFYPSTEWKFDRPFDCLCGEGKGVCVGAVSGAEGIDGGQLGRWFVNGHILGLAEERDH